MINRKKISYKKYYKSEENKDTILVDYNNNTTNIKNNKEIAKNNNITNINKNDNFAIGDHATIKKYNDKVEKLIEIVNFSSGGKNSIVNIKCEKVATIESSAQTITNVTHKICFITYLLTIIIFLIVHCLRYSIKLLEYLKISIGTLQLKIWSSIKNSLISKEEYNFIKLIILFIIICVTIPFYIGLFILYNLNRIILIEVPQKFAQKINLNFDQ